MSVTVFDWDDTLFATSVFQGEGLKPYSLEPEVYRHGEFSDLYEIFFEPNTEEKINNLKAKLTGLDIIVHSVLTVALSKSDMVYIVTNAIYGWVEKSAEKFLPTTSALLSHAKLKIMSARHYEQIFPNRPIQWKTEIFNEHIHAWTHVISIGDSLAEYYALANAVAVITREIRVKRIKMVESPTLDTLCRQLSLLAQCFPNVHAYQGDLDLALQIGPQPTCPSEPLDCPPTPNVDAVAC